MWIFNANNLGISLHRKQTYFVSPKRLTRKLCESLREHAKNIIDFGKKKKNVTVNKRRIKITSRCKSMLYLWKKNVKKLSKSINYQKVRDHCQYTGKYRGATDSICNLKSNVPIKSL